MVESAIGVFQDRLDGIVLVKSLAPGLPSVMIDRDQFRRVMVNLVDNAAEAMLYSAERRLTITTQLAAADTVELIVSDTGHGIQPDDMERLFNPPQPKRARVPVPVRMPQNPKPNSYR